LSSPGYEAFWSYAHEDNDRQGGRLLALARAIEDEFSVISGDDLNIFLDRHSLSWGDLWKERINGALGEAPFFIALVTPKYVRSAECRRELLSFSREAQSRGVGRLLLPILFIDVSDLSDDSSDEMLAIISRSQYVDWRELRLKSPSDPAVLVAVNSLARRMQQLRQEAKSTTQSLEARDKTEVYDNLSDLVDAIDEKIDDWLEAVEFDHVSGRVWRSTVDERLKRAQRLIDSGRQGGPMLAVFKKLGLELQPIAVDRLVKSQNYSRSTIYLDPLITAVMRQVSENPELLSVLDRVSDGVQEAVLNIEPPGGRHRTWRLPTGILRYSRTLQEADDTIAKSMELLNEANEIVLRWRDQLVELQEQILQDGESYGNPVTQPNLEEGTEKLPTGAVNESSHLVNSTDHES